MGFESERKRFQRNLRLLRAYSSATRGTPNCDNKFAISVLLSMGVVQQQRFSSIWSLMVWVVRPAYERWPGGLWLQGVSSGVVCCSGVSSAGLWVPPADPVSSPSKSGLVMSHGRKMPNLTRKHYYKMENGVLTTVIYPFNDSFRTPLFQLSRKKNGGFQNSR